MGGLLVFIGLIVLANANGTSPGTGIGLALIFIGALVYIFRKDEEF